MKKKRIIQFCLFALMLGLSVLIFANQTLAADKQNTNNNTTVSENTIDPIKATSVAFLQSGKSNTMVKNTPNMPIFPVSQKLVKSGVTDPYLNTYTNYDNNHTPLPIEKQDLVMESDGSGGYTAYVYTAKGFIEAIFDPASYSSKMTADDAGWPINKNNRDGWKDLFTDANLYSQLNTTYNPLPISKIHNIIFKNNIDIDNIDGLTAANYHIDVVNPQFLSGTAKKTGTGNVSINQAGNGSAGGHGDYNYIRIRHDKLTINGDNHWLNMGYNNWALLGNVNGGAEPSSLYYKEDWTLENMDCYGSSYFGVISCNTGVSANYLKAKNGIDPDTGKKISDKERQDCSEGLNGGYTWITYKDITYTGSQFSWTKNTHVAGATMEGNVVANTLYTYKEPGINSDYIWQTESDGNQQLFEEDRVVFKKDCKFTGATYDGNGLELTGSAILESGAKVNLYPHGYNSSEYSRPPEHNNHYLGWGLYFNGSKPTLDLYGDSQLNIHCDNTDGNNLVDLDGKIKQGVTVDEETQAGCTPHIKPTYASGALNMNSSGSKITYHETKDNDSGKMLSPEINIDNDGPVFGDHSLVNFGGGNADLSHGKFSIDAKNLNNQKDAKGNLVHYENDRGTYTGGLMTVTGTAIINVKTGGDFSIASHNKAGDDYEGHPVNLLYYSGGQINLMNPKNVSLDLRDHNDLASALVFSSSSSKINAYDTRVQAYGDNNAVSQSGQGSLGVGDNRNSQIGTTLADLFMKTYNDSYKTDYSYNNGQVISLGMQGNDSLSGSINGAVYKKNPIRMQTLTLPFSGYGIDFTQYLSAPGNNVIQGHQTDLDLLKAAMVQMNGREFRYVRLSDLPGPTEDAVDKVGVPGASSISQKDITGQVGGDYWANDDESDNPLFSPVPPLLRVQLKHKDSDSFIDLGTMPNSKAAQEKTNADPTDSSVTEVTPNPIDSNRNVRTDDKGNYMTGTKITTGGDTSNPQPKYLDSSIVKWDNGSWSDTSSSENDPQHSFSYNLQEVLKNYNENHTDKKISFQPGDQVITSVVTNYQETPVQNTRITNLYLQKGKEPKTPFLVGDQITMPFQYIDTIDNASPLDIKGAIYKLDDNGNKTLVTSFERDDIQIDKTSEWKNSSLDLPTEATSKPGKYVVEFNGTDKLHNTGPDKDVSWNYTVSNLPKYNGKTVLNDHTTGDTTKPSNIVSNLHYTVKTVFEAVNTTNGTLSEVMFNHPNNADQNIEENSDYTLTASYIDKGQTINKQLNSGFEYGKYYSPKDDFGISKDNFPAGVKFTITHKILVNAENKDDGVQIGADQMYSTENGEDILLGTSNSIKYNSVGSIVLNVVNNTIDYGTNPVAVPLKKERVFFIPKTQDPIVSVTNNTPYSQPIILTAQVDGDTSGLNSLNNWLYYRKTKDNTGYSDTPMTNKVTVFHDSVGTNVSQNISSRWFNKDGKQVTGPILKLEQNSSPNLGTQHKYNTKITWNLTNSL